MKRLLVLTLLSTLLLPFGAQAVSVSPGIFDLSVERGTVIERTISVMNTAAADDTFYLSTLKFLPREESGAPDFVPPEVDHSGLPEWISFPSNRVEVPARSRVEVPFQIAIPNDIPSGGYYAAIVVSDAPSEVVETNGASIQARVASLLLLTVEGETVEKLGFLDFTSPQDGAWTDLPAGSFAYRVQNQGNVHVSPRGKVTVRDFFGRVVAEVPANPDGGRILPGSTRAFEGTFGEESGPGFWNRVTAQWRNFAIGPVTAELTIDYGKTDETIMSSFGFWVVPVHLLGVAGAAIVLLVLIATAVGYRRRV